MSILEAKKILESMVNLPDIKIKEYEEIVEPLYHFVKYISIKRNVSEDQASKMVENYCIHSIKNSNNIILQTKDGIFEEICRYYSEYAKNEGYNEYQKIKDHKKRLLHFMFDVFGKDKILEDAKKLDK